MCKVHVALLLALFSWICTILRFRTVTYNAMQCNAAQYNATTSILFRSAHVQLFTLTHKTCFCTLDEWYPLSTEEVSDTGYDEVTLNTLQ